MTLQEILYNLSISKERLFQEYPIRSMAIFGSYSRKEQNEFSDLDIVVDFFGKIGIRFIDLAEELEKITACKIDLVSKKGIKKKYFSTIESDLIYV